jgi:hypothetical protein
MSEPAAEISAADLLGSITSAISDVADAPAPGGGCPRATKIAIAFYNGLSIAAPETAPMFAAQIVISVRETQRHPSYVNVASPDELPAVASSMG